MAHNHQVARFKSGHRHYGQQAISVGTQEPDRQPTAVSKEAHAAGLSAEDMPEEISEEDILHAIQHAIFIEGEGDGPINEQKPPRQVDFSQFHPLMHRIGSKTCRGYYGGTRRHLQIWWWYKFDYKPVDLWHRWVLCHLNRHDPIRARSRPSTDAPFVGRRRCRYCHIELPLND